MRQRLHLARATLGDPAVLLLDEPTIGLDPEIARGVRQLVVEAASRGTAVVLTTHYMQEADELCDDLVLIKQGRKIAAGTPRRSKPNSGRARYWMRSSPSPRRPSGSAWATYRG